MRWERINVKRTTKLIEPWQLTAMMRARPTRWWWRWRKMKTKNLHSNVLNNFFHVYDDGGTKSPLLFFSTLSRTRIVSCLQLPWWTRTDQTAIICYRRKFDWLTGWFAFEEQMMNWHHSVDLFSCPSNWEKKISSFNIFKFKLKYKIYFSSSRRMFATVWMYI